MISTIDAAGRYNGMGILIDDGRFFAWRFSDYIVALCKGERPSFMHHWLPGPADGEVLVNDLGGKMVMNSRTYRSFIAELEHRADLAARGQAIAERLAG